MTRLFRANRSGTQAGNDRSNAAGPSPDGRFVAFRSRATDLATASDLPGTTDVFAQEPEVPLQAVDLVTRLEASP